MHIVGKLISLRDLKFKDLEIAQHWMHPSREWHRFNGPYYTPTPAEELPEVMSRWAKRIALNDYPTPRMTLAIVDTADNIIGQVNRYWISQETNWTAIGISIWSAELWE